MAELYFRIPDSDPVWVGHYYQSHKRMTAAKASALFVREQHPEGYEAIIPQRIKPQEIHRIHHSRASASLPPSSFRAKPQNRQAKNTQVRGLSRTGMLLFRLP